MCYMHGWEVVSDKHKPGSSCLELYLEFRWFALYYMLLFPSPLRFPFSSSDSLLHCSAVWSEQCDPHSAVAAPTVWWWDSSQLHHHCQSRLQSSHHQWNKCSSHCTLQCDTHCQYCGNQLQWEQQCCYGDHTSHRYIYCYRNIIVEIIIKGNSVDLVDKTSLK